MTITTKSDERTVDKLKQLRKLIDVVEVTVLDKNNSLSWLVLIKMKAIEPAIRMEIINYASIFEPNVLDIAKRIY
jgi:acetolactate synthase-1/3 small subunit